MNSKFRWIIVALMVGVFVTVTPFLIIYSLGYNIHLNNQTLENSFSIKIDTLPFGAGIRVNNKQLGNSPSDFQTNPKNYIFLEIAKDNYIPERFELKGDVASNSSVRINNLWLQPKNPIISKSISTPTKTTSLIDQQLITFDSELQQYFTTLLRPDLNSFETKTVDSANISKLGSNFVATDTYCYFDNLAGQSFFNFGNLKMLIDWSKPLSTRKASLKFPFGKLKSQVCLSDKNVWLLDSQNQLWRFDPIANTITFVDNKIDSMTMDLQTKFLWLRKSDTIFRVAGNSNLESFGPTDIYLKNLSLKSETDSISRVSSIFQGVSMLSGRNLVVIFDKDKGLQFISPDALTSISSDNAIFWLDSKGNVFVWNFTLKQNLLLGKVVLNTSKMPTLIYNNDSKRLFIYSINNAGKFDIQSFWYNKDILNEYIVSYSQTNWLSNLDSLTQTVIDKYQYTIEGGTLKTYKIDNLL